MNNPTHPRSFWPIGIMAFFAVALVFLVTYIIWASYQREDLVAENYYDNEVRFQQQLDQMNRTQPLAAQIEVAYDAVLHNIVITLPAAQAVNAVGQISLSRPSDASLDRSLPLAVNSNGVQQLDAKSLPNGLWKIRVKWTTGSEEFFIERTVIVAGGAPNTRSARWSSRFSVFPEQAKAWTPTKSRRTGAQRSALCSLAIHG